MSQVHYEGEVIEQIQAQALVVLLSFMKEYEVMFGAQAIFAKLAFFDDTYLTLQHKTKFLMALFRLNIFPRMTQIHKVVSLIHS